MSSPPREYAEALDVVRPRLGPFAGKVCWYSEVTSTSDIAAAMADAGAEEGLVITADAQTAGRGRLGRRWVSPAGAGVYASVVFRPARATAALLTLASGVAIAEGIELATGLAPLLKWPNDLYVGPRKLAGILAEAGVSRMGGAHVVVGFGINVLPGAYPVDVGARATSLESELGRVCDRGRVLAECLAALASRYEDVRQGRAASVVAAWRSRAMSTFGARIAWESGGGSYVGVVKDIAEDGALLVENDSGRHRMMSGEVRWL